MAADNAIVQHVIKETLEQVEKSAPLNFQQVTSDPAKWVALNQAIRDAASEEVRLAQEIRKRRPKDSDKLFPRRLFVDRMQIIQEASSDPVKWDVLNQLIRFVARDQVVLSSHLHPAGQANESFASWCLSEPNRMEIINQVGQDPAQWDALNHAISQAKRGKKLRGGFRAPRFVSERLLRCLSKDRIKMIREGLKTPTFRMHLIKENGKYEVNIKSEGNWFLASRELESPTEVDWAMNLQCASILVDAVLVSISVAGIALTPTKAAMEAAVDDASHAIRTSSKLQQTLLQFTSAWSAAGSNSYQKAKALSTLVKTSHDDGHAWSIMNALCENMTRYERLEIVATVIAMRVATLATDGTVQIAKFGSAVSSAVYFNKKVVNVAKLYEIGLQLSSE